MPGGNSFLFRQIHAAAKTRKLHLPGQESQRRSPIRAFPCWRLRYGMVVRDVKPNGLAVCEKQFLLRRFVLPAHASWPFEIDGPRFDASLFLAFTVSLEKYGLQGLWVAVVLLQQTGKRFRGVF